jgi:hypothetical protein
MLVEGRGEERRGEQKRMPTIREVMAHTVRYLRLYQRHGEGGRKGEGNVAGRRKRGEENRRERLILEK